jgi:hypothetical protein
MVAKIIRSNNSIQAIRGSDVLKPPVTTVNNGSRVVLSSRIKSRGRSKVTTGSRTTPRRGTQSYLNAKDVDVRALDLLNGRNVATRRYTTCQLSASGPEQSEA